MSQNTPKFPVSSESKLTPLEVALQGKSEEFKRRVMDFVNVTGYEPDDPIFIFLVATGRLEVMLEEAPNALDRLFKHWNTQITKTFELVDHALIERQKLAIAQAAGDIIRQAERQEARRFFSSLIPAAGVLLSVLGLGFVMGVTVPPYLQGGYTTEVKLTAEQVDALRWASSKEGKFARNLMRWNGGYLDNLECTQDIKRLNIRLNLGSRSATSGFCTIWVTPPEQRKYAD
ncbi:DUF6753 family protein [Allocoleopsis franciscana]|uniref:Uncharacterized protein n=1 Tax=Allocoleopsis franciscana PCC 7113 TaxID=1173027 RepID=K9WQM7_9CYAN|nr:DUF6753 family protein [Allocoleopsis franciscana]AFZ22064.1 hypothetical protein Mic7113_6484 [Allocoleopsis franciscana PCC 7113]